MAVEANTYGTETGVELLIGDVVDSGDFTVSTDPTTTDVEKQLDAVAHDLNRELEAAGYTVPVTSDDATALAFLEDANDYGAAARVLAMFPGNPYDPDEDAPPGGSRVSMYGQHLKHAIKMIQEHRLKAAFSTGRAKQFEAGARLDTNSNTRSPLFTRGMTDLPGSRSHVSS